ncbi:MAG TPA: glycosyltransferase family 1 protein [Thermoanaerobaculaceae bacterium]|nr:glycosyltransferase family 1 protein [Thermoanaerobaculaceae bacterium]
MSEVLRIGVDGKALLPPRAGVARYLEGLLAGCAAVSHPEVELDVVMPGGPRRTLPWVVWNLQRATARGYSVFHFPFYYPPLAPRCPVTVAIHDVLVLEHPEWFRRPSVNPLRRLAPRGARLAAAVVTGSRCVADAIAERCKVPRERIHLTGYGVDRARFAPPSSEQRADVLLRLTLSKPYLLQLGALEPRRGVDLALAAVASLRVRDPDLELVLVGAPRAPVPVLEHPPPWVRLLGWVEDADLPVLYAGAEAVLAPSRGEGFNLPLLEALACGAVVVASDIPVHREHFTPAVELFASGDAEALAAVACAVLGDSGRAATLRTAGPALAAGFDWVDVARRHLDLWRQVGRR